MNTAIDSPLGKQLYQLLPEVYRSRDNGDLANYMDACGGMLDMLQQLLKQRLDDSFPATCQPWLLPYFAQLMDVRLVSPEAAGQRMEVANAVAWRQRKGTRVCIEQIAENVGQMEVELHEGWQRVATTARIGMPLLPVAALGAYAQPDMNNPLEATKHPGLPVATVDFRFPSRAQRVEPQSPQHHRSRFAGKTLLWQQAHPHGVPCFPGSYEDRSQCTVDLRQPDWHRGRHHPKRMLMFTPPPQGFFPPGQQPVISWEERVNHDWFEEVWERYLDRHGKLVERRIFLNNNPEFLPVITGMGSSGTDDIVFNETPVAGVNEIEYCFKGLHFDCKLIIDNGRLRLERVAVSDVSVNSSDSGTEPLLQAQDSLLSHPQTPNGLMQLEYCTVLQQTVVKTVQASDCLFMGELYSGTDFTTPPQDGCLRYSRIPAQPLGAIQQYKCTTEQPIFYNTEWNQTGSAALHPATPDAIRTGAEDGGELGACHYQRYMLRIEAMREKLKEFLPVSMESVFIADERLNHAPPN